MPVRYADLTDDIKPICEPMRADLAGRRAVLGNAAGTEFGGEPGGGRLDDARARP
jgi:hypothetical protein